MDIIKAIEDFEYFQQCTGGTQERWEIWIEEMIEEWRHNRSMFRNKDYDVLTNIREMNLVRRLDNLGRIVIPVDLRKRLLISSGDAVAFSRINEYICMKKWNGVDNIQQNIDDLDALIINETNELGPAQAREIRAYLDTIKRIIKESKKALE